MSQRRSFDIIKRFFQNDHSLTITLKLAIIDRLANLVPLLSPYVYLKS